MPDILSSLLYWRFYVYLVAGGTFLLWQNPLADCLVNAYPVHLHGISLHITQLPESHKRARERESSPPAGPVMAQFQDNNPGGVYCMVAAALLSAAFGSNLSFLHMLYIS
jgi:hypothetical protein